MHDLYVWTIGQERYILCCNLEPKSSLRVSYPTIGGCIYCIASSPLVPTKLALGLGDNTVKIWDLSHPENQRITMINLWRSIQGKVFTLAWHPTNESQLAFGTHEGRIGLINVNKPSSTPLLLFQHFRTPVHQVVWGPINGNKALLGLYACGEGEVAIYDTSLALTQEPRTMLVQAKKFATCTAWKPDYTQFAIGFKSGEFEIYDGSLIYKFTIFCEHKAVFNIVWHPEFTEEDSSRSPNHSWIAISTADAFIIIYDLNCETVTDGSVESNHRLIVELHGHSKPVTCMCWSPYENSKLASSGQDGIIQVWDVKTSTIIGTYFGHNYEKILSVCWSPLKKDYLISGGKDNCIRIWDLTKQCAITEENLQEIQKESIRLKQNRNKQKQPNENDDQEANKKVKRGAMLNLTSKAQNNPCTMLDDCKRIFSSITQKKPTDLEPAQDVDAEVMNNFDITKLFGDKSEVLQLLEMEQEKHAEKKKYINYQHLALWKGNLAEALKEAISNQTVTPWLISMAPMVSPKLWQEACAVYTTKLLEDTKTDPFELISYLLACHKVEEAVKVLCDETLFREALALAKCRLPKDHPLINEIISLWAKFAIINGSFEIAAQCFIVLEQYEEATKALFKRSDEKTLKFAVELAEKTGNKHLIDAVTLRYNSFKNLPETPQENIASNI
ncbi:WD40 domain-containing protein, partial [Oryctes borbonicus]